MANRSWLRALISKIIRVDTVEQYNRRALHLKAGDGVTLSVADSAARDETEVTISASGDGSGSSTPAPTTLYVNASTGDDDNDGLTTGTALATMTQARSLIGSKSGAVRINVMAAGLYGLDGWDVPRAGSGAVEIFSPMSLRTLVHTALDITAQEYPVGDENDPDIIRITVAATLVPGSLRGMIAYSSQGNTSSLLDQKGHRAIVVDNEADTITLALGQTSSFTASDTVSIGFPTVKLTTNGYRRFVGGRSAVDAEAFDLNHIELDATGVSPTSGTMTLTGAWRMRHVTLAPEPNGYGFEDAVLWLSGIGARWAYDGEDLTDGETRVDLSYTTGQCAGYFGYLNLQFCGGGGSLTATEHLILVGCCESVYTLHHTTLTVNLGFVNETENWGEMSHSSVWRGLLGTLLAQHPAVLSEGYGGGVGVDAAPLVWTSRGLYLYVDEDLTLTALTFPQAGVYYVHVITSGAFTVTWPAAVLWAGGTPPVVTTTGRDLLQFVYDGTEVTGSIVGQALA